MTKNFGALPLISRQVLVPNELGYCGNLMVGLANVFVLSLVMQITFLSDVKYICHSEKASQKMTINKVKSICKKKKRAILEVP